MPEWLKEFTEDLVHRDSKSSGSDREHPPETPFSSGLYPSTAKEEHTIYSRIFRRIQKKKSAGAPKLRVLFAEES